MGKTDRTLLVVGGGLFGSLAAHAMVARGWTVRVFDDVNPLGGSRPAGGLMKPGWMPSGLDKDEVRRALSFLDGLGVLRHKTAELHPVGATTELHSVAPEDVLWPLLLVERATVNKVNMDGGWLLAHGTTHVGGQILLATGAWSPALVPDMPEMQALRGVSFRVPGRLDGKAHIKPWAPYKQIVAHQIKEDEIWIGDGTAILAHNWTLDRLLQCWVRCAGFLHDLTGRHYDLWSAHTMEGLRPYVKGHKAGYFTQVGERTHLSTGGAKNGTILAAIQALRLADRLVRNS